MSYVLPLTAEEVQRKLAKIADLAIHSAVASGGFISVAIDHFIENGSEIKFKAPVDCTDVTRLQIQYTDENQAPVIKTFAFADANGNDVGEINNLFAKDAVVKVILDTEANIDGNGMGAAFVQNADTNAYLENRLNEINAALEAKECIVDVTELPNPNDSAKFIYNREEASADANWICYVVESLPETGEAATDSEMSRITAYYNKTNNEAYGYVDNALGSQFGISAGWYPISQLFEIAGVQYGGVITSIAEDPYDDKLRILFKPATGEINEEATYRVLNGVFVHNKMLQNHCVCHTVEWTNGPAGLGDPVLSFPDNALGLVVNGYYNIADNTVYGYFDDITIEELGYYVDSLDLNDLAKLALKAALKAMSKGWKTMEEVFSLVGSAASMSWGGVIASITEANEANALYLLLSSKLYFHRNNAWIGEEVGIGMPGGVTGAEIFNDPNNIAFGTASHAEGRSTEAYGEVSHAEGYKTIAEGKTSHAEGEGTIASGMISHAEGLNTTASGEYSHAEGYHTVASGLVAHAEGIGTKATAQGQHVSGMYNAINNDALFIVGKGSSDTNRSNAFIVDKGGNVEASGTIKSGNKKLATEEYVETKISTIDLTSYATKTDVDSSYTIAGKKINTTLGQNATAEGRDNTASGMEAHAEGVSVVASGHYSHAEGFESKATGLVAHAEGQGTVAEGYAAHAEGYMTHAGHYSHAEGHNVNVTMGWSHGEGKDVVVSADVAHGEGLGTIAASAAQHVQGAFNIADAEDKYLHIIGNGSDDANRSNAHTIDWNGNAWYAGDIKVGGTGQDDPNAKIIATEDYINSAIANIPTITNAEIDEICGASIYAASEVEV